MGGLISRFDMTNTRCGQARHGMARCGRARHGAAGLGMARQGSQWLNTTEWLIAVRFRNGGFQQQTVCCWRFDRRAIIEVKKMATKSKRLYRYELTGITPLLMHADNVEEASRVQEWQKDPGNKNLSVKGDDRSPAWVWQTYLYKDCAGNITIPSDNLMVALRSAGAQLTLKGNKTFKAMTQTGLWMEEEHPTFTNGGKSVSASKFAGLESEGFNKHKKAVEDAGFDLLIKRAKVGTSKHVRVRPMFRAWKLAGTVSVLAQEITTEHLEKLFELAGGIGLCDWRPSSPTPGRYGQFEAKVKKA